MKILAIDPGTKKVGYVLVDGREVIQKGVVPYKNFKTELNTLTMFFNIDLCILEKGGVPQAESKIKRLLGAKNMKYIEYVSADVREELGLFDLGIDNQNKRWIVRKNLGVKEYNRDIMDAALLIVHHYQLMEKKGDN
jgi:thermostable 8-oxoguanine DNA glycosylase